jgi:hypothetical protein
MCPHSHCSRGAFLRTTTHLAMSAPTGLAAALRSAESQRTGVPIAAYYAVVADLESAPDNASKRTLFVQQVNRVASALHTLAANGDSNTCFIMGRRDWLPRMLLAPNILEAKEENPQVAQAVTVASMQTLLTFFKAHLVHGLDPAMHSLQNTMAIVVMVVTPRHRLFMSMEKAGNDVLVARQL